MTTIQIPDPRPGFYYVSCKRDDGASRFVRGPWTTHEAALAVVDTVRDEACKIDSRAWFYAWGTARSETDAGPGALGGPLDVTERQMARARAKRQAVAEDSDYVSLYTFRDGASHVHAVAPSWEEARHVVESEGAKAPTPLVREMVRW